MPYAAEAGAVVLALSDGDRLLVSVADPADLTITGGHNAGGEPRSSVTIDNAAESFTVLPGAAAELLRRGAWARCMQTSPSPQPRTSGSTAPAPTTRSPSRR